PLFALGQTRSMHASNPLTGAGLGRARTWRRSPTGRGAAGAQRSRADSGASKESGEDAVCQQQAMWRELPSAVGLTQQAFIAELRYVQKQDRQVCAETAPEITHRDSVGTAQAEEHE